MQQLFANNANSTLAHNISKEQTSITLEDASRFPEITPGSGNYYLATLLGSDDSEIIKITHKQGNTLTALRGWEDTPAQTWLANTPIEMRPTAATLRKVPQSIDKFEVGDIIHAITAPSPSWLPADGTLHPVEQYPQLAKLLPTILPSGYFTPYHLHTTLGITGTIQNLCFSPCGRYFGIGTGSSPYIYLYRFNSTQGSFESATIYDGDPIKAVVRSIGFYTDGKQDIVIVGHGTSSVKTYYFNNELSRFDVFYNFLNNKENISVTTSSTYNSVNFSKNGRYCALGRASGSRLDIFRNTKIGFQRIYTPYNIPSGVEKTIFTPDGRFLILQLGSSPYLRVYEVHKNGGNSYWSSPSALGKGATNDIALSPNGKFLAAAHASAPYLTIASVNNGYISALAELPTANRPDGAGNAVAFSPDGQYLAVANTRSSSSKKSLVLYQFNQENGSLQKLQFYYQLTGSQNGGFLDFSPCGKFLALGSATSSESVKILVASNSPDHTAQFQAPLISTAGTGLQAYIKAK